MNIHKKQIDIETMISDIKKFDKTFRINSNQFVTNKGAFDDAISNYKLYIIALALSLVNIPLSSYFVKSRYEGISTVSNPDDIINNIKQVMNNKQEAFVSQDEFKIRFLLHMITELSTYISDIIQNMYNKTGKPGNQYANMFSLLKEIDIFLTKFIIGFIKGEEYDMISIFEIFSFARKNKRQLIPVIRAHAKLTIDVKVIEDNMLKHEDVIINDLMKLAYIFATESVDVSGTPDKIKHLCRYDTESIHNQIKELGYVIADTRYKRSRPVLYKSFSKSHPYIISKSSELLVDEYFNIGCRALVYAAMILNQPEVYRLLYVIL